MTTFTATYDPGDNKIRLYASSRLDSETYERAHAAGFRWAPMQKLFFSYWNPAAEDIAVELAGEMTDEDKTLVERAEERADRFEDYQGARAKDAAAAHKAVHAIADGIPFGQPILVGHHSERHARRDAERIENGMRKAVKMWETSEYWKARAAGAIRHAKYVERTDVRHRRIKKLESELRKQEGHEKRANGFIALWSKPDLTLERATALANHDHVGGPGGEWSLWSALNDGKTTPELAAAHAIKVHGAYLPTCERWVAHLNHRLEYERAMMQEAGGLPADKFGFVAGGKVLVGNEWCVVIRVNRAGGKVNSLRTTRRYGGIVGVEEVKDYRAPEVGDVEKVKAATKVLPLCNYKGGAKLRDGFEGLGCNHPDGLEMTKAELKAKWHEITKVPATATTGAHRRYCTVRGGHYLWIFVTDLKVKEPRALAAAPAPTLPPNERELPAARSAPETVEPAAKPPEASENIGAEIGKMKETLRAGVKVVSAPQLFPTPRELAARMVALADIQAGQTVLEPSAGTGNIVQAIIDAVDTEIVGYEINAQLCANLSTTFPCYKLVARCQDFLEVEGKGQWERIVMNPPFDNGSDIAHILHARSLLAPGGKLVAICAGGPRQVEKLHPLADSWEWLPSGTFAGTGVRTALLTMTAPAAEAVETVSPRRAAALKAAATRRAKKLATQGVAP